MKPPKMRAKGIGKIMPVAESTSTWNMRIATAADAARIKGRQQFLAGLLCAIPGIEVFSEVEIWKRYKVSAKRDRVDLLVLGKVEVVIEVDGLYRSGSRPGQVAYSPHTMPYGRVGDHCRDAAIFRLLGLPVLRCAAHDQSTQIAVLEAVKAQAK